VKPSAHKTYLFIINSYTSEPCVLVASPTGGSRKGAAGFVRGEAPLLEGFGEAFLSLLTFEKIEDSTTWIKKLLPQ
jgi:hypothetical protein